MNMAQALRSTEVIFPAMSVPLPRALAHTNDSGLEKDNAYNARIAEFEPIVLGRLPSSATLRDRNFLLECDGGIVSESIPHVMRNNPDLINRAVAACRDVVDIKQECLLLSRYGHGTWGHWLGEILPIAAVVERRYPGRFRYAVPTTVSSYNSVVRESLRAYGIDPAQIIPVSPDKTIKLINAWGVTPIWTDRAPHPAAVDIMRGSVRLGEFRPGRDRIALMRRDWPTRGMSNSDDVEHFLQAAGFTITDAGGLPFVDQVRLFQSATTVFAVLGSGLTGLIYSPNCVNVVAAAPSGWGDRFFYALAQHRDARWSEVRGPSNWDGNGLMRDAPFNVPLDELAQAIRRIEACDD